MAAALTALAVQAGCSSQDDSKKAVATEKITYLTSFGNFGRDAYAWVAKEKGYFKEAGLDVDIKAGKGSASNIQILVGGKAQFVPMDFSGFMLQLNKGAAKDVVAVAAIQQHTLAAIMTLDNTGITSPKDLEGKRVADSPSSTVRLLFPTYAKLAGVDASKVEWVNGKPATLPSALASGKVDAIGQFVVGKPTIEAVAKGKKAVALPYSDVMSDLYGNVLLTTKKMLEEKPDVVKRFTRALLKGLEYSINNPEEAGAILKKNEPSSNPKAAAAELAAMAAYVKSSAAGLPVGALEHSRVARSISLLQSAGAIKEGFTPEQVISTDVLSAA